MRTIASEEEPVAHETQLRRKTGHPSPNIPDNLHKTSIPEIMASYEAIPESSEAEFSHFEEAAAAFDALGGSNDDHQPDENKNSTFLEMLFSFYLPLAAVWLRRSLVGIATLVRTLILGHLFRLATGNLTDWLTQTTPTWLQPLLYPMGTATNGKLDPKAWPPPALTALALLTVGALVIHPDGFTWVMVGKARNAIMSVLWSFSECWQVVITDYGVMPTIIASATIATLIFLMFAMLRSVSPRKPRVAPAPEKKKKKRKGQNRHRANAGKTKVHTSATPPPAAASSLESSDAVGATTRNPNSDACPMEEHSETKSIPECTAASTESVSRHSLSAINNSTLPAIDATRSLDELTGSDAIRTLDTTQAKTLEKDLRGRGRVTSVSTLDTTTLSDDQSCGSTSIRSFPSVSVASSKSNQIIEQTLSPVSCTTTPSVGSPGGSKSKATTSSTQRRDQRFGRNTKSKGSNNGPSRWDVLKPSKNPSQPHPPSEPPLANSAGSTPNRDGHGHSNRHHQQSQSHRPNGRRGIRGSNTGTKKGRSNNKAPSATLSNKELTSDRGIIVPHKTTNARPTPRTPVSPPRLSRKGEKNMSSTSTLLSHLSPSPRPGWASIESSKIGNVNAQGSFILPARTTQPDMDNIPSSSIFQTANTSPTRETFAWGTPLQRDQDISTFSVSEEVANRRHSPSFVPSTVRIGTNQELPCSPAGKFEFRAPSLMSGRVKENPFAPDNSASNEELDKQIEADLKELGGQMAGSILDF